MKYILYTIVLPAVLMFSPAVASAENIDPQNSGNQYAWGENIGWVNFEPAAGDGVQVSSSAVKGLLWCENIGWINLSPRRYGGVVNDGAGNLSGFAWGENVGWINFRPVVDGDRNDYGVKIDAQGRFYGWAWGENIGWINFSIADSYVAACKVGIGHLAMFASEWLGDVTSNANLDGSGNVGLTDFNILASYWLDFCPDAWPF